MVNFRISEFQNFRKCTSTARPRIADDGVEILQV